jgi:hypothetical protein
MGLPTVYGSGRVDKLTVLMGAGYVVGDDLIPLTVLTSPVDGPLASIPAEAASLLALAECRKSTW